MTIQTASRELPYAFADELQSHGALTILPLFPADEPALEYVGLDEAAARGLSVAETSEEGDVTSLLLHNPLDERVLVYEGEELVGAKQNRILQRSILVEAHSKITVPVHCVEQGRWAYRTRRFAPAPRAAYPALRRANRVGQHRVWAEISAKQTRMQAPSATGAAESLYLSQEDQLAEHLAAFPRLEGQTGVIAAIGGRVVCLDYVGRPEVWAGLHAKLVRGYALDALEAQPAEFPSEQMAELIGSYFRLRRARRPRVGLGMESVLEGPAVGSELTLEGEVVALSLFPAEAA